MRSKSSDAPESGVTRRGLLQGSAAFAAVAVAGGFSRTAQASGGNAITDMTAVELRAAIAKRSVSCREVMQAYLDRIDAVNPVFNAIVSRKDSKGLLAEADKADEALARGDAVGPLHGFPQAPKDLAATTDIVTTQGSLILAKYLPKADAIVVERARKAGAILIGKTNTPEFGLGSHTYNAVFGTTVNAWDPNLAAGGSSGGAAVALAQRMLPVADGSDMMGSLRNPAGWNNVVGFRASQGRIPYGPTGEVFMQQLGYEGPMGRTVADTALLLSVQAGFDARAPLSLAGDPQQFAGALDRDFKGARIGYLGDFNGYLPMEAGVLDVCAAALKHFETIGCAVEAVTPDYDMNQLWQTWLTLRGFLIAGIASGLYAKPELRKMMKPEAIWEIESGMALTGPQVFKASADRSAWYQVVRGLFERYDFLVLPTAQVFPFDAKTHWPKEIAGKAMDTYHRWMEVVVPGTLAGVPAAGVPAGFSDKGLPMGLQILGPAQADLAVLQIAHAYEQASGFSNQCPPDICGPLSSRKG